jgi:hypothetical protein
MAPVHPFEVRGRWMRVSVRTPYDVCDDFNRRDAKGKQSLHWIRYLDERGRPLVVYGGPEDHTSCD